MANPRLWNGVSSPLSIYETTTYQHHRIGERGHLNDRAFRYSRISSTTFAPNVLLQSPAPTATHTTQTGSLGTLGGTTGFVAGSTNFSIALGGSATADLYEDGYIKIQSSTLGPGQIYKLKKHAASATVGGTSNVILVETYDPIVTTPTGTVTWTLKQNPWADVIIMPTSVTGMACGVPLVTFPTGTTAAPYYGWVQTWGTCSVLNGTDNLVVGSGIIPWGTTTAGAIGVAVETDIKQRIGISLETITTDNIYATVLLQIAP